MQILQLKLAKKIFKGFLLVGAEEGGTVLLY